MKQKTHFVIATVLVVVFIGGVIMFTTREKALSTNNIVKKEQVSQREPVQATSQQAKSRTVFTGPSQEQIQNTKIYPDTRTVIVQESMGRTIIRDANTNQILGSLGALNVTEGLGSKNPAVVREAVLLVAEAQ